MIGPLSDKTMNNFQAYINKIINTVGLKEKILQVKQQWHAIELARLAEVHTDDERKWIKQDCAQQFGQTAELIARQLFNHSGLDSLKDILVDKNHSKDLSIGDFVLRHEWYNNKDFRGAILIDTKFCYTDKLGCYGSFSTNSELAFGGWYLCFDTNCDSVLALYSEYVRECIDNHILMVQPTGYLYKDYKHIIPEAISAGCAFICNKI